ncbi:formate dehydrogenase subunit gamma [Sphingopyxis flava]|uniref:Formate dehydrogenase gamma subunit n=1 Tax=Sphingopyxis flava TaxID=1507287 RepID=A0A1T5G5A7_9SPHN|nr:formate dehydrogenase subunit gamma [Sphingopyxis flava]SKC03618.1 formate dehydrogenase gamma subunit [Sphingopyxis flava]
MDLAAAELVIADWIDAQGDERDQLLPLLHHLQREIGYIDDAAIPFIAAAFNLSRADVHGVLTFYHDFRRKPAGRHIVKLCRAESCQARGGAAIEAAASRRLGVAMGETRRDGQISLEPVYCLGLCAIGPNALVDGRPVARIDAAMLDTIAAEVAV